MSDECYFCESEEEIEEHHILPQRFDGSDAETNIVDVCHDCHWKLERLYNKDFWEALGIEDPRATKKSHVYCNYKGCKEPAEVLIRRYLFFRSEMREYRHCRPCATERYKNEDVEFVDEEDPDVDDDTYLHTTATETERSVERMRDFWESN